MPALELARSIPTAPRAGAAAMLAALLGACAPVPPAPPPAPAPEVHELRVAVPVQVPVVDAADLAAQQLLAYNDRLRQMNAAELAQEVAPRNDATLSPAAATHLALALGFTRNNGDLQRAQVLLDQVLRNATPEAQPWQALARLVSSRLSEQRRLEDQIERLNQQARDNQRENQRRIDQLNDKLEALKAIERSLNSRPAAAASTPAAGSKATPP